MWSDIPAIIKALTVVIPLILAVMRLLRPRRIIGFLVAVWNREKLHAVANAWMAEAQTREESNQRWKRLHDECQTELMRLDTEVARLRTRAAARDDSGVGGN